jgi:hypothetical protein
VNRNRAAAVVVGAALALAAGNPASAHRRDLMTPNKAGPILRSRTTMAQVRTWFGPPSNRRVIEVGCVQVIEARWGRGVTVYASRGGNRTVAASFIPKRIIRSPQHGELRIHTRRGLHVGASEARLRRLYPGARPITHAGHTHYRLSTGRNGPYLMAKVVDQRVVQFENWPYEFC